MNGTVVLVHGAGSGPWIFDSWVDELRGFRVEAPDLHAGLDVSKATMGDYAANVERAVETAERPVGVCGWSMGGLVAAMVADSAAVDALVLIEPSPPAEVQGTNTDVEIAPGSFDSEVAYGAFPAGIRARPESTPARAERKRGIPVPALPARTLVVCGDEFPDDRGESIASHYGCEIVRFPGLDHWGLIQDGRVSRAVAKFFLQSLY